MITTIGCSNDDSSDIEEYFEYQYDNNNVEITNWEAVKNGDRFVIRGVGNEQGFAIEFNKYGHLSSANSYSTSNFSFPLSQSYIYYSSHSFNFNLIDVDTDNHTVKASFDGLLYEDNYDINSPTHQVSGEFNLKYAETPETELSSLHCKFDNQDWYSTNMDSSSSGSNVEVSFFNDDEYIINFYYDENTISTCNNCAFTANSNLRMQLNIYDPVNDEMIECNSTGTLSITNYTPSSGFNNGLIEGDFNFTATNPNNNQTYHIDNGHFKLILQ